MQEPVLRYYQVWDSFPKGIGHMSDRIQDALYRLRQTLLHHIVSRPALHTYCAASHGDCRQPGTPICLRYSHTGAPALQFCPADDTVVSKQRLVELRVSGGLNGTS